MSVHRKTADGSLRPGLQRYVIAWAEHQRAQKALERTLAELWREAPAAREALRIAVDPVLVRLLDGQEFDVFMDTAGIVVVPRSTTAAMHGKRS